MADAPSSHGVNGVTESLDHTPPMARARGPFRYVDDEQFAEAHRLMFLFAMYCGHVSRETWSNELARRPGKRARSVIQDSRRIGVNTMSRCWRSGREAIARHGNATDPGRHQSHAGTSGPATHLLMGPTRGKRSDPNNQSGLERLPQRFLSCPYSVSAAVPRYSVPLQSAASARTGNSRRARNNSPSAQRSRGVAFEGPMMIAQWDPRMLVSLKRPG